MSILKRISNTISSQINYIVGEIENHDAVIEASIIDLKQKIAKAIVRKKNMSSQVLKCQNEVKKCEKNVKLWQSRAIESANSDEKKALACMSRASSCEEKMVQLKESLREYGNMEIKLSQDITSAESNMRELMQKHELMRARQSSNSALIATQELNYDASSSLNETFDRWEIKLQQSEVYLDSDPDIDTFEHEFVHQEKEEELKNALNSLIKKNKE